MKTRSVWGLIVLLVGLISYTTNVTPAATEKPNVPDEPPLDVETTVVVGEANTSTEAEVGVAIGTPEVITPENKLPIFDTHVHYSQTTCPTAVVSMKLHDGESLSW